MNKKTSHLPKASKSGFSLIEILVVVTIIGILMGLAVPAVSGALRTAKKTEARAFMTKLSTALSNFQTEYQDFPTDLTNPAIATYTPGGDTYVTTHAGWVALIDILRGNTNNPSTLIYVTNSNPRRLTFIEVESKYLEPKNTPLQPTKLFDPFGNPYQMALDFNFDNVISNLPSLGKTGTGDSVGFTNAAKIAIWSTTGMTNSADTLHVKEWVGNWQ